MPSVEACDGNEHCLQLAFAKLILCCNVRCKDGSTELNIQNYKNNVTKYIEYSCHFLLSFRLYVINEEKKKEKSNSILNSFNSTPILFSNMPLNVMIILFYKFVDYCPIFFQNFKGQIEKLLPYALVHSDNIDISIKKQKIKNTSYF